MLNRIAHKLSKHLIEKGADEKSEAVYAYAIEALLSTTIILILLIVAGLIIGKLLPMLVYIAVWLPMRIFVGGAHAKTHVLCTISSVGLGVIALLLQDYINMIPAYVVYALMVVSYVVIWLLAPVVHKNHPISHSHRRKMQVVARILGAIYCVGIAVLAYFKSEYMAAAFFGCFSTVIMAIVGYVSKDSLKKFE